MSNFQQRSVQELQKLCFSRLTLNEKITIKKAGRPTPILRIQQAAQSRSKEYLRQLPANVYEKCEWICGCGEKNALFCFTCLLYGGDNAWTESGVTDLKHLNDKIKKHELSNTYLNNSVSFSLLGSVNIRDQIDSGYKIAIARHNEQVKRNREVLSKIIDCLKFCGRFGLPLRGHDESEDSQNPGVFRGLLNFVCEFDSALDSHFKTASVFKGTSKSIQNDLLDCMFDTLHFYI